MLATEVMPTTQTDFDTVDIANGPETELSNGGAVESQTVQESAELESSPDASGSSQLLTGNGFDAIEGHKDIDKIGSFEEARKLCNLLGRVSLETASTLYHVVRESKAKQGDATFADRQAAAKARIMAKESAKAAAGQATVMSSARAIARPDKAARPSAAVGRSPERTPKVRDTNVTVMHNLINGVDVRQRELITGQKSEDNGEHEVVQPASKFVVAKARQKATRTVSNKMTALQSERDFASIAAVVSPVLSRYHPTEVTVPNKLPEAAQATVVTTGGPPEQHVILPIKGAEGAEAVEVVEEPATSWNMAELITDEQPPLPVEILQSVDDMNDLSVPNEAVTYQETAEPLLYRAELSAAPQVTVDVEMPLADVIYEDNAGKDSVDGLVVDIDRVAPITEMPVNQEALISERATTAFDQLVAVVNASESSNIVDTISDDETAFNDRRVRQAEFVYTPDDTTTEEIVGAVFNRFAVYMQSLPGQVIEHTGTTPGATNSESGNGVEQRSGWIGESLAVHVDTEPIVSLNTVEALALDKQPLEEVFVALADYLVEKGADEAEYQSAELEVATIPDVATREMVIVTTMREILELIDVDKVRKATGEAASKVAITPELTEKLLILLDAIGYEDSPAILVEFVAKFDVEFLADAIRHVDSSANTQQASYSYDDEELYGSKVSLSSAVNDSLVNDESVITRLGRFAYAIANAGAGTVATDVAA